MKKNNFFWTLVAGLGLFFLFLPYKIYGDASIRFIHLSELYHFGVVENPMKYSIVGPLFSYPIWHIMGLYDVERIAEAVQRFNFVVFLIGLWTLYTHLKDELATQVLWLFLLILTFASMMPHHLANYYPEVFTTILAGLGLVLVMKQKYWGWLLLIIGSLNTPASFLGLGFVVLYKIVSEKRLRYLAVPLLTVGLYIFESLIRMGSNPFTREFGYEVDWAHPSIMPFSDVLGFGYPLFFGLISIVFSFGRGLIFYLPGLWLLTRYSKLNFSPKISSLMAMWLWYGLGLILVYAKWHDWHGGWFWGPRYFLFLSLPASLLLAKAFFSYRTFNFYEKALTLSSLVLSLWVGLNGLIFPLSEFCADLDQRHLCWYTPHYSELWSPLINAHPINFDQVIFSLYYGYLCLFLISIIKKEVITDILNTSNKLYNQFADSRKWKI